MAACNARRYPNAARSADAYVVVTSHHTEGHDEVYSVRISAVSA